jgi:MiaB-like tRNA modifying enzyme
MASIQSNKIKKIIPDGKFLPPQYSHHIIDLIDGKKIDFKSVNKTNIPKYFEKRTAPIAIAEGCMFDCSYCITCLARGKLKSYPIEGIKNDIKSAIKNNCFEIQITSQDTSSYGLDIDKNLGILLKNITKIEGKYKIRVGMMNPYTCHLNLKSIIDGYDNSKIYKFLHLPVQSGDKDILKKMNRKYTIKEFKEIINKFKQKYPDISISTDIIVAFPTETKNQFDKTLDLIKETRPDITNITRYSARPYTKAKKMNGRIKTDIAKKRSKILTDLCKKISIEKNKEKIGKKYNVIIQEKRKKDFFGRTENYKPVIIREDVEIGKIVKVKIIDSGQTHLVGSII